MADNHAKHARQEVEGEGPLARPALRFTAFTEQWLPDAFGFVLVGTIVVLLFGLGTGEPLLKRPDNPTATKGNGLVDALGTRLLEPDHLHVADGNDHHRRLHRRDQWSGGAAGHPAGPDPEVAARGRRLCRGSRDL